MINLLRALLGGWHAFIFLALAAGLVVGLAQSWYISHIARMGKDKASTLAAYMGVAGLAVVIGIFFWLVS